jgi:hypothetical protein
MWGLERCGKPDEPLRERGSFDMLKRVGCALPLVGCGVGFVLFVLGLRIAGIATLLGTVALTLPVWAKINRQAAVDDRARAEKAREARAEERRQKSRKLLKDGEETGDPGKIEDASRVLEEWPHGIGARDLEEWYQGARAALEAIRVRYGTTRLIDTLRNHAKRGSGALDLMLFDELLKGDQQALEEVAFARLEGLARLFEKDRKRIVLAAIDRLDDRALADRAYFEMLRRATEPEERKALVEKISGQEVLFEVLAAKYQSRDIRDLVVKKLANGSWQQRMVMSADHESALYAVEKIADEDVLAQVVHTHPNPSIRRCAAERISNQVILEEIARTGKGDGERRCAVRKMSDSSLLAEVACSDESPLVRAEAVRRLTDTDLVAKMRDKDRSDLVRLAAADVLGDSRLAEASLLALYKVGGGGLSLREIAKRLCGDERGVWCERCHGVVPFSQAGYDANEPYNDDRIVCPKCGAELSGNLGRPDISRDRRRCTWSGRTPRRSPPSPRADRCGSGRWDDARRRGRRGVARLSSPATRPRSR